MSNPWFRFYHEALDDPKVQQLSSDLFRDWVNLLCLTCRNDGFLPDLSAVTFALRKSESDTMFCIESLVDAGLLDRFKSGRIRPHNWDSRQFKSDNAYDRVKRFRKRFRNVTNAVTETDQIQNRTDTPIVPLKGTNGVAYPVEFESFWVEYPRHEGKGAALKAWKKINPSQVLQEKIIGAVRQQKTNPQWLKDRGQFIPHASTWLNQLRWDDDIRVVVPQREQGVVF